MRTPLSPIALGLSALAMGAMAQPAGATLYIATWEGTVTSGSWDRGSGNPVIDLRGLSFTAVYTIDDSKGSELTGATYNQISGYLAASPVSAVVTVGQYSWTIDGNYYGLAQSVNNDPTGGIHDAIQTESWTTFYTIENGYQVSHNYHVKNSFTDFGANLFSVADFRAPLSHALDGNDVLISNDFGYETLSHDGKGNWLIYDRVFVYNMTVSRVTVAPLASGPVPEPASWAMMIGGLGIAGAALRRRPRARVAFA